MKRLIFILLLLFYLQGFSQIKVCADFEGGNVKILQIDGTKIFFKAAYKTNQKSNIWFYFKLWDFPKDSSLSLYQIIDFVPYTNQKLIYSYDNRNWHSTNAIQSNNSLNVFKLPTDDADTIFIALTFPYTYSMLMDFIDSLAKNYNIDTTTLTYSEHHRRIPLLIISDTTADTVPKDMLWIIARQHAFEVPANYFTEGLIEYFLSNDSLANFFRKQYIAYIVPMMDVDNVAEGKSGRSQLPVDFNRDWRDSAHWAAIQETQNLISSTADINNFRIFIDIHSVFPDFYDSTLTFFNIYPENSEQSKNLSQLFGIFSQLSDLTPNEIHDQTQKPFADLYMKTTYPYLDFSVTLEVPWNTGHQQPTRYWRKLGKLFAKSLIIYLTSDLSK